ncbi:MAG TPA: hypothetical protein VFF42_02570 [Candidatus Eremiobacteraceae bacterium]|nr:hypothetical protein [Candidatus Eremiobacteraceae bacterium]
MKRQSVISWLTIFCGILLCAIGPFGETHAQAQTLLRKVIQARVLRQ